MLNKESKIAVGADHAGVELKGAIVKYLRGELKAPYESERLKDVGSSLPKNIESVDYPEIAYKVADLVGNRGYDFGVLVCGTGLGMSIVANKLGSIRAALCLTKDMARLAREHNNANVLCLGGRIVSPHLGLEIAKVFFETEFSDEKRHKRRIKMIKRLR